MVYELNTNQYIFSPQYIENFPSGLENWVLLVDYNQDGKEDDDIQIIALSATIPNPSTVKNKFLPDAEITKITVSKQNN